MVNVKVHLQAFYHGMGGYQMQASLHGLGGLVGVHVLAKGWVGWLLWVA